MQVQFGIATALVTPFTNDGKKINYYRFKELIDWQINCGINALVFLGTTGEASTLSIEEKKKVCLFAVKYVNRRAKVIMGAGANDTSIAIEQSKMFEALGADALLHVTPYYNKTSQKGLILHYKNIASSTKLPVILYNVPSRTGVNLTAETTLELAKQENIIAIKEASGNMEQIMKILKDKPKDFSLYSGEDSLNYAIMSMGGSGAISVLSNVMPERCAQFGDAMLNNDYARGKAIHEELLPLARALFIDVNPIPVKTMLNIMGKQVGALRLPLCNPTTETKKSLKKIAERYHLM